MPVNLELIKEAFPSKAWAYTVMHHGVAIGLWDGADLNFHPSAEFDWEDVTELRIFNPERELRFICTGGGKLLVRDSKDIEFVELRDCEYVMYGTNPDPDIESGWTVLTEDRGGVVYFPKALSFESETVMWLGIRNYLRFTDDLRLIVCDYAFTGFMQGINKKEVTL